MCELGVFPNFVENEVSKVDKILRLTFFKARKYFEGLKTEFFHLLWLNFFARLQLPFIRVEETVL